MRRIGLALSVLLAVLAGAGSSYWFWTSQPRLYWTILLQQADGNLALSNEQGEIQPLTMPDTGPSQRYLFPAPAPDGRSVAAVAVDQAGASGSAALVVLGIDGTRSTLYDQPGSSPFYLSWSPDSQKLAFLTGTASGMTLHAATINDQPQAKQIAPGQPSYFAWSPDSQRLLLHIGGSSQEGGTLQVYEWGSAAPRPLAALPGPFQAPAWTANGERGLAVVQEARGAALAALDAQGNVQQRLLDVPLGMVFVPSPDASQIAYLTFAEGAPQFGIIAAADGTIRTFDAQALTCFWSPRGDALAFLTIVPGDQQEVALKQAAPRLRWNVLTPADGAIRTFEPFQPSREFINLLPYFDQYALSHRLWDRSGSRLLYAADDGVYVLDVRSGQSERVGDGVLGLWMER